MAATATSNVIEMLRYTYGTDRILYLMNEEVVTFNILSKVKKPVGGRGQFLMPITLRNPGTWKGMAEGGTLATALAPDTSEASYSLQEFNGIYDMSWKLLQDARTSKFAFKQAVDYLDEGFRRRFMRMLNADFLDDGRGRLAILTAQDDDTVVSMRHLPRVDVGQVVDVMDDTDDDTKLGDSLTVTAVDTQARTVTLSAASNSTTGNTAAGDYLVIEDTTDISVNATAQHTNGLLGIVDSSNPPAVVGNIGGVNRSTAGNEGWKAFELGNGGVNRPLMEDLILQALDGTREKGSGKTDKILSNLNIARRYHEMLRAESFYAISSKPGGLGGGLGRSSETAGTAAGDGKTPYEFSGISWHTDPYTDANVILGLDTSSIFIGTGENEVPRPISEIFDSVPKFKETSKATFEVVWYWQAELITNNPSANWKIGDVAES